jgi:peptide/nickel transport system ATP-binding protein
VETGSARDIIKRARHPYSRGLLASTIHADQHHKRVSGIPGSPPDLALLPDGCAFAQRCSIVGPECRINVPELVQDIPGHRFACFRSTP